MKTIAIAILCVFSLVAISAPVEAAKKTTTPKKTTCQIKLGKILKINLKF